MSFKKDLVSEIIADEFLRLFTVFATFIIKKIIFGYLFCDTILMK